MAFLTEIYHNKCCDHLVFKSNKHLNSIIQSIIQQVLIFYTLEESLSKTFYKKPSILEDFRKEMCENIDIYFSWNSKITICREILRKLHCQNTLVQMSDSSFSTATESFRKNKTYSRKIHFMPCLTYIMLVWSNVSNK